MNLPKCCKFTRHSNAVAAGSTVITPSAGINMGASAGAGVAGFDEVTFLVLFGTITGGAVTSIEVHQSSDDGVADAYSALAGTNVAVPDTASNKAYWVTVVRPLKQYVKCIVNRATANAVLDGIMAFQSSPKNEPVTHDTTIGGGELHVAPAEGTA